MRLAVVFDVAITYGKTPLTFSIVVLSIPDGTGQRRHHEGPECARWCRMHGSTAAKIPRPEARFRYYRFPEVAFEHPTRGMWAVAPCCSSPSPSVSLTHLVKLMQSRNWSGTQIKIASVVPVLLSTGTPSLP